MSKIVAGTAFVLLSGATVTGSVLLSKAKSSDQTPEPDIELPTTLESFKTQGKDKGCLKTLFSSLEDMNSTTGDTTSTVNNFFGSGKETKGCLVVNWDKNTKTVNSDTKWNGTFRLLWAIKGKVTDDVDKGFVVFLAGKAPDAGTPQEIQWEGSLYTLSEEANGETTKKWKAKQRQDVGSNKVFKKESGSDNSTDQFPQPGTDLKGTDAAKTIPDFWGWFSGFDDLAKIASTTAVEGESGALIAQKSFRAHWEWTGKEGDTAENKKQMTSWTKEMDKWWNKVFDSSTFALKTVSDAQKGIWTVKKYQDPAQS